MITQVGNELDSELVTNIFDLEHVATTIDQKFRKKNMYSRGVLFIHYTRIVYVYKYTALKNWPSEFYPPSVSIFVQSDLN